MCEEKQVHSSPPPPTSLTPSFPDSIQQPHLHRYQTAHGIDVARSRCYNLQLQNDEAFAAGELSLSPSACSSGWCKRRGEPD